MNPLTPFQLSSRLREDGDPLIAEARKLEQEAGAAEAAGQFSHSNLVRTRAIERFLELLKLEPPGRLQYCF